MLDRPSFELKLPDGSAPIAEADFDRLRERFVRSGDAWVYAETGMADLHLAEQLIRLGLVPVASELIFALDAGSANRIALDQQLRIRLATSDEIPLWLEVVGRWLTQRGANWEDEHLTEDEQRALRREWLQEIIARGARPYLLSGVRSPDTSPGAALLWPLNETAATLAYVTAPAARADQATSAAPRGGGESAYSTLPDFREIVRSMAARCFAQGRRVVRVRVAAHDVQNINALLAIGFRLVEPRMRWHGWFPQSGRDPSP